MTDLEGDTPASVLTPPAPPLPQPTVTSALSHGYLKVHVEGVPGSVTLRDIDQKIVAGGVIQAGETGTDIGLGAVRSERHYYAQIKSEGRKSAPLLFVVNPGSGSLEVSAPEVPSAQVSGDRIVATISGDPSAVIRISDADGVIRAVKMLNANGTSQVAFTAPRDRDVTSFSATQTVDGITSTPVDLPLDD